VRKAGKLTDALAHAKMITFDQCATAYIAAHRSGWKNAKHASQWENTLSTYATPVIGSLPVAAVDTALVVKVLGPIWKTKTETASRLRGQIESILDWATVSLYRQGDNPARWRGHLENLLADPGRVAKVAHHTALPWQAAGTFMAAPAKEKRLSYPWRPCSASARPGCRAGWDWATKPFDTRKLEDHLLGMASDKLSMRNSSNGVYRNERSACRPSMASSCDAAESNLRPVRFGLLMRIER
jgi:hypothetical protein